MVLLNSRNLGALGGVLFLVFVIVGCAGTRKKEEAGAGKQEVEKVLGLQGQQETEQPQSEDEVLKLLGISGKESQEGKKTTSKQVVEETEVEKLQKRVGELEGQLRDKENEISSLKSDLAAKEKAISDLESRSKLSSVVQGVVATGKPHGPSSEFKVRYQDALAEYHARSYSTALKLFQELLGMDANNTLSDNCQYWTGECYYGMGDYDKALVEFEKVFTFPETNKAPDAQLKIGLCYLKQGSRDRARQELQRLLDNYPSSEYVPKARQLLSQL